MKNDFNKIVLYFEKIPFVFEIKKFFSTFSKEDKKKLSIVFY